jgi:hypothetical protein
MRRRLPALLLVLLGAGCFHTPGGIAPSDVPLTAGTYDVLGPVSASDCRVTLFGLIPLTGGNELHAAMEKARSKRKDAQALIRITVDASSQFWILFGTNCTTVDALAVKLR